MSDDFDSDELEDTILDENTQLIDETIIFEDEFIED